MDGVRAWMNFFSEMGAGFIISPHADTTPIQDQHVIDAIAEDIRRCKSCRLADSKTHYVPGEGSSRPEVMFIGEGPGETEDQFGRPFIGAAGQLLTKVIEKMGFGRSDVFITNVVKCRPPQNREPAQDEVEACRPFLLRQIEALNPRVIVCLGKVALTHVLGISEGITKVRGQVFSLGERKVVPTFHPSYILHQKEKAAISKAKWQVWEDMQVVLRLIGRNP